jgi:O-antigen ligase
VELKLSSLGLWVAITVSLGVLLGTVFGLSGVAGIFASALLPLLVVLAVVAAKFPIPLLGFSIAWLALCPFTWGMQTGLFFRLFADETPLLLYLAVVPFLYVFTARVWHRGFGALYFTLLALVSALAVSFVSHVELVAYRNFVSTYVLGAMLLVLILQEAANSDAESIGSFIIWITVAIAALSIVERIFQSNPFVENTPSYVSAELVRVTAGVYRPYVSFFHPSEAGAFMALGTPFVVRGWLQRRTWVSALTVCTAAAGLFVNGTRGVWFGLFIAALLAALAVRRAWLWISVTVPVLATVAWIGYLAFRSSRFMTRLSNPEDLYSRLETWRIAAQVFLVHPLLGVGFGNFRPAFSNYVQNATTVATADNIFVSTAVENGLVGLLALTGFFTVALILLRRTRLELDNRGMTAGVSFVRCAELALIGYIAIGCFADLQDFRKVTKYMFLLVGLGLAERVRHAVASSGPAPLRKEVKLFVQSRESAFPRG